ncbi:MFS general substrate transporter [Backusella circina FSU 941]|nr:MFS general substrate transporter [Backusella circina FSU 941]
MVGASLEVMETHNDDHSTLSSTDIESTHKKSWFSFCGPDPQVDPRKFPQWKKNSIVFIVAMAGAVSPISSTVYYPAMTEMQTYFNATATQMNASVAIFTFFIAFFPVLWATWGDVYGRKRVYLLSFIVTIIGSVCCALSVNIEMLIVFRAISAIGSSSAMSMGAGTLSDIFESHEKGRAFAFYNIGPVASPAIGPIVGGYLNQGLGWRSNFWFLTIFTTCVWFAILFGLPETWRPAPPSSNKTVVHVEYNEKKSPVKDIEHHGKPKRKFVNPLSSLKLFLYPNIALVSFFVGLMFFALYINYTTFTRVYTLQYGFGSGVVGLCYLTLAGGLVIGSIIGGRSSDKEYIKRVEKAGGVGYPEMRIGGFWFIASILFLVATTIAYGWCVEKNVHYAIPLVIQVLMGLGMMFPNVILTTYMVDCFRERSASVTACNNFARYIMAGIGSLLCSDMQEAMGYGPLFTFAACLVLVGTCTLFFTRMYEQKWIQLRKSV